MPEGEIERLIPKKALPSDIETLRGYVSDDQWAKSGRVLEVKYDGLVAQVTLAIGKQRVTSIISADAARELRLKPGE